MALDRGWANFLHGLAGFGQGYTGAMDKQFERKRESDLLGAKMAATAAEGEANRAADREKLGASVLEGQADRDWKTIENQKAIDAGKYERESFSTFLGKWASPYEPMTEERYNFALKAWNDLHQRGGEPGPGPAASPAPAAGASPDGPSGPGYISRAVSGAAGNIGKSMDWAAETTGRAGAAMGRGFGRLNLGAGPSAGPGGEGAARGGAALRGGGGPTKSRETQLRKVIQDLRKKFPNATADQIEQAMASQGF